MPPTYYVTTPIYYVNDVPHIGHSYTTIAADVLARFHRMAGFDVRFLTGTDEHGIKIVKAAAEKGTTPLELSDTVVVGFHDLWRDLNISHDDFIRTSEPRHEKRVQSLITTLLERDEIYLGEYAGWYDESQEEFVTESAARDNEYNSEISGKPLTRFTEPSYFFRLSKWIPWLIEYIEANPDFVQPVARRNEVLSKCRAGVEDLSISRLLDKLDGWGIPLPNDPAHSVYVWIDALSNYFTALGIPSIGDEHDEQFPQYWPADVHLVGKDILWFHAVYWPCILKALDMPLPKCVFAHGWWTADGKKMQKSLGNFIDLAQIHQICEEYSRDVYRYTLLRTMAFGADGDFSREGLRTLYNTELANGVGNLLSRTVKMIDKYFDGAVPAAGTPDDEAQKVIASAENLIGSAASDMSACAIHGYLDRVMAVVDATNRFIEATEPFKLAKDDSQRDRLGMILAACAEAVRLVLVYLEPFMPETSGRGLEHLGWSRGERPLSEIGQWSDALAGGTVNKGDALFPRMA
ncbi:MAG: methionine--tRNA ligase [Planctomycetota bacterium]|jgi:methionyl-tRNA synthetase